MNGRGIDAGKIKSLVLSAGLSPVKEYLFPVIVDAPVSSLKKPQEQLSTAKLVCDTLLSAGIDARIITHPETYPAVYGEIKSDLPNAPTILIGGHYDGQPSVKSLWHVTEPHTPKIVDAGGETRVYGRGTSDDWGQVLTHILAVKMIRASGAPLPVNLKFLIEGGEEVGSPGMDKFILEHKDLLKCDLVILTDSAPGRMNFPVITTTARGLAETEVELKFGTNNLHSGDNLTVGVMEVLASILSLKDLKTRRVNIPGFYDRVKPLSESERAKLNAMPLDLALYQQKYGLDRLRLLAGHTAQETIWAQPSYEWHTVLGPTKEAIPMSNTITTRAIAYVSMRIVADQDPAEVLALFKAEVYRRLAANTDFGPEVLTFSSESLAYPFKEDVSGPYFQAVAQGMAQAFEVSEVDYGGCGGTEPIAIYYQKILRVPVVFNAFNSPADNYHGNDESFSIERGFQPGIVANALIYQHLSDLIRGVSP